MIPPISSATSQAPAAPTIKPLEAAKQDSLLDRIASILKAAFATGAPFRKAPF